MMGRDIPTNLSPYFELDFLVDCSNEAILEELRRVASLVQENQPFTISVYTELNPKVSYKSLKSRFGGWKEALQAAGLGSRYKGPAITERMKTQRGNSGYTESELIAELNRVHAITGKDWLSSTDFNMHSITSHGVIGRRFGSFLKGLEAAGIPKHPRKIRAFTDEQCFENIANLWAHYGRAPMIRELSVSPSTILPKTYVGRWGTWRKSLVAFVDWANNSDYTSEKQLMRNTSTTSPTNQVSLKRTEADCREIRPGLRFKVFKRDGFRCIICGRSPATHLNIELHADHIIAVANNGKTTFENLRTLCQDCNLGKGKS